MEKIKQFLNEKQDPRAVAKVLRKVNDLLTANEQVQYIAVEKKPILTFSPDSVVLTDKRVIFCRPKMFGLSMDFQDYPWKDIADCHMRENVMGATFSIKTTQNKINFQDHLPKAQARMLYRYAQEREEEMSEYRRQRNLEHARASAGGVVVNTMGTKDPEAASDPQARLKKLKGLLEDGLIEPAEFEKLKAETLAEL